MDLRKIFYSEISTYMPIFGIVFWSLAFCILLHEWKSEYDKYRKTIGVYNSSSIDGYPLCKEYLEINGRVLKPLNVSVFVVYYMWTLP